MSAGYLAPECARLTEERDAARAERDRLRTVVAAVAAERAARAAWLATVTGCTSPPPRELLDAEAATGRALEVLSALPLTP